jgi:hypothetical protein
MKLRLGELVVQRLNESGLLWSVSVGDAVEVWGLHDVKAALGCSDDCVGDDADFAAKHGVEVAGVNKFLRTGDRLQVVSPGPFAIKLTPGTKLLALQLVKPPWLQ